MPHKVDVPQRQRPRSAPPKRTAGCRHTNSTRPAIASKRVINGSSPASRKPSKYHERCFPHWIPAPGLSTKKSKKKLHKDMADKRESYPLCLVCEYDHTKDDESIHELYERFQKGAHQLEELDKEVRSKAHQQKAKVLKALWEMDKKGDKPQERPKQDKIVQSSEADSEEGSWQDILDGQVITTTRMKRKKKKTKMPSSTESEVDLLPDRDWSLKDDKKKTTAAMVHKKEESISLEEPKKRVLKAKKKSDSTEEEDVIRKFVDQSFERHDEEAKDKGAARKKREQFKQQVLKEKSKGTDQNSADKITEKDIIKEFVDQSLEKDRHQAMKVMEQELAECLDMIENSISGKIIDVKKESNESSTNVSVSLTDEDGIIPDLDKKDIKKKPKEKKTRFKTDADVFTELIIDELKRENRDLKFSLVAREQKLEDAATKVRELIEQNTMWSKKVAMAAAAHSQQTAEMVEMQKSYEAKIDELRAKLSSAEEKRLLETRVLDSSTSELEATICQLKMKLTKSEDTNKNLQTYVDHLKKSYQTVFGAQGVPPQQGDGNSSPPSSMSQDP